MIPTVFIPGPRENLRNYWEAIYAAGGVPICSTDCADSTLCSGLLLPGGGDIGKSLYGSEQKLIQSFVQSKRPILGICRGMQALNVYFGGDLHDRIPGHQQPRGDLIHRTLTVGRLARLLGRCPAVTSNHHQALRRLGRGLQAVQVAPDGIIEAVEHATLPIWGVQWHPERQSFTRLRPDAADAAPLFTFFLSQMRISPWQQA